MRVKDLKALARETLLKWYGSAILARMFREILVVLSMLVGFVFLGLSLINVGALNDLICFFEPDFVPSTAAAVIFMMFFLITMAFTLLLDVWMTFGYEKMLLNICRGRNASSGDILSAFKKESRPWKVLWVCILRFLLIISVIIIPLFINGCAIVCGYDSSEAAWCDPWRITIRSLQILSVMWMVYLSLGFTFASTIIIDKPETGVIDALKISLKTVTGGRKPKLFWLLSLSFLPWMILVSVVPFASLWILPYIEVTLILYYLDGLGELEQLPAYRELLQKKEEEEKPLETPAAEAGEETEAGEEREAGEEAEAAPVGEKASEEAIQPENQSVEKAEEESEEKMEAIPRKIIFPDIEAEPAESKASPDVSAEAPAAAEHESTEKTEVKAENKPAQPGTEE